MIGTIGLTGCNQLARMGVGVTEIQAVVADPTARETVTIQGKVVNQVGLFGQGVYELQDPTGTVWVVTQTGLPAMNSTVIVKGQPQEGLSLGGRNFGVTIREAERL
ncbi:MAG: hypothetical protein HC921_12690 [Synechococcaceae cyanobacterium SM2_3_1]|nr:hypothetical protein [Synechococcaceae cyanobacterium SM2_3_1]